MAITKEPLLGSWVAQAGGEVSEEVAKNWWCHFRPDNFFIREFFVQGYGWNVNWYHYLITGDDEITLQSIGNYQIEITPFPFIEKVRFEGEKLHIKSWLYERSDERQEPPPYDLISMMKTVEVGPPQIGFHTSRLLNWEEVEARQELARAKREGKEALAKGKTDPEASDERDK